MPIEYMKWITREDIQANPDKTFVFGDNIERRGHGGQAKEMRGEPNSLGVATKAKPRYGEDAYMDQENPAHWHVLQRDMLAVEKLLAADRVVVFPMDGIGTGLALLSEKAPKMAKFIADTMTEFERRYGVLTES